MAKENDTFLTPAQAADILKISSATVKNWVRLGKLTPQKSDNGSIFFAAKYIKSVKLSLSASSQKSLKQRRNKKMFGGTLFPSGYLNERSPNLFPLRRLSEQLKNIPDNIVKELAPAITASVAIKLVTGKDISEYSNPGNAVGKYLNELLDGAGDWQKFVSCYPELFAVNFIPQKNEDTSGAVYLTLQRAAWRKSAGAYYTPEHIIKKIYDHISDTGFTEKSRILDPCCGTGNFLLQLPDFIEPEFVYGCDYDKTAITLARINFAGKYGINDINFIEQHIVNCDFIRYAPQQKFDFIIGNPPWGGEVSPDGKKFVNLHLQSISGKSLDTFSIITGHAINLLNENGILNFLLPEAILNVKKHLPMRRYILQNTVLTRVELLGEMFHKVNCPAVILGIKKSAHPCKIRFVRKSKVSILPVETEVSEESFNLCNPCEQAIIKHMENIENVSYLAGNAEFALGIVTGNNSKFVHTEKLPDTEIIIAGSDLRPYIADTPCRYIQYTPERFQQTAPEEIYRAKEKILYKFISNRLVFAYDNNQTLPLNSCNILIPYPEKFNMKYILAILNSSAAQFYFKTKFNSVKVLRHHLEKIPIPQADPENIRQITALVDEILAGSSSKQHLHDRIDLLVSKLYKFSDAEHLFISQRVAQ